MFKELVRRKDKSGKLAFPHLTDRLVTKCGTYAWRRGTFDLEQHLIFALDTYRGRAINELNIQVGWHKNLKTNNTNKWKKKQ